MPFAKLHQLHSQILMCKTSIQRSGKYSCSNRRFFGRVLFHETLLPKCVCFVFKVAIVLEDFVVLKCLSSLSFCPMFYKSISDNFPDVLLHFFLNILNLL